MEGLALLVSGRGWQEKPVLTDPRGWWWGGSTMLSPRFPDAGAFLSWAEAVLGVPLACKAKCRFSRHSLLPSQRGLKDPLLPFVFFRTCP